jgi:sugar phosphate isomerase/epimerase
LPKSFEEALATATLEIRRIGTNINQLAHHANLRQAATLREVQQARQLLTALEAAVTRFIPPLPAGDDR